MHGEEAVKTHRLTQKWRRLRSAPFLCGTLSRSRLGAAVSRLRHGAEWIRARLQEPVKLSEAELDKAGLVLASCQPVLENQF